MPRNQKFSTGQVYRLEAYGNNFSKPLEKIKSKIPR